MDSFDIFLHSDNLHENESNALFEVEDQYLMGMVEPTHAKPIYDRLPGQVKGYYCPAKNMFFVLEEDPKVVNLPLPTSPELTDMFGELIFDGIHSTGFDLGVKELI